MPMYHGWQPEGLLQWFLSTALNDLDANRALDTCVNASRCSFPPVPHPGFPSYGDTILSSLASAAMRKNK